jgi:hypothetical protein
MGRSHLITVKKLQLQINVGALAPRVAHSPLLLWYLDQLEKGPGYSVLWACVGQSQRRKSVGILTRSGFCPVPADWKSGEV